MTPLDCSLLWIAFCVWSGFIAAAAYYLGIAKGHAIGWREGRRVARKALVEPTYQRVGNN